MLRIFFALALTAVVLTARADSGTIHFSPLPLEGKDKLPEEYLAPMYHLKNATGRPFQLVATTDYEDLIKRFRNNEIDLAFIGPLPYVTLTENFTHAQPLVHFLESNGSPTYTCALITRTDLNLKPADLKNKKIALTQNLSTCGPLAADEMLRNAGLSLTRVQSSVVGAHDKVAMEVAAGEFDAGSLKTSIAKKYLSLGIRIIAESSPKPGFALVANTRTMDAAAIQQIRDTMLALKPATNPEHAKITKSWGAGMSHGAVSASDADYNDLRSHITRWKGGTPR